MKFTELKENLNPINKALAELEYDIVQDYMKSPIVKEKLLSVYQEYLAKRATEFSYLSGTVLPLNPLPNKFQMKALINLLRSEGFTVNEVVNPSHDGRVYGPMLTYEIRL